MSVINCNLLLFPPQYAIETIALSLLGAPHLLDFLVTLLSPLHTPYSA